MNLRIVFLQNLPGIGALSIESNARIAGFSRWKNACGAFGRTARLGGTDEAAGAARRSAVRRDPSALAENIECGSFPHSDKAKIVALIDDVFTTESHYAACGDILAKECPGIPVIGLEPHGGDCREAGEKPKETLFCAVDNENGYLLSFSQSNNDKITG